MARTSKGGNKKYLLGILCHIKFTEVLRKNKHFFPLYIYERVYTHVCMFFNYVNIVTLPQIPQDQKVKAFTTASKWRRAEEESGVLLLQRFR